MKLMTKLFLAAVALLAVGASLAGCKSDPIVIAFDSSQDLPAKADGQTAILLNATVTQGGAVIDSGKVTFTSSMAGSSFSTISDLTKKDPPAPEPYDASFSSGTGSAKLYSMRRGTATITATWANPSWGMTATTTKDVIFKASELAGPVTLTDKNPTMKASTASKSETLTLSFLAKDSTEMPLKKGTIKFAITGSTPSSAATGASVTAEATTDDAGVATATVTSGNLAGTLNLEAYALAGTTESQFEKLRFAVKVTGTGVPATIEFTNGSSPVLYAGGAGGHSAQFNFLVKDSAGVPVPKELVKFEVKPPLGGGPPTVDVKEAPTDDGGVVWCNVTAGTDTGSFILKSWVGTVQVLETPFEVRP